MGYNLSENAFKQVKPILDELIDLGIGDIWKQSFQDNTKAARMIRQGFEYCIKHENVVGKRYAELKQNIRIRVTNDYVLAERKFAALQPLQRVEAVRRKDFPGLVSFNEVVSTFLSNRQLTDLSFPHFEDHERINELNKICKEFGYYAERLHTTLWIIKNGESTRTTQEHTD